MLIATYFEWRERKPVELLKLNPRVLCPDCNGEGEFDGDGEAPFYEICERCFGDGRLYFVDLHPREYGQLINVHEYFKAVITDLRQWCVFTRQDFLEVAGHFVNEFREGRYA